MPAQETRKPLIIGQPGGGSSISTSFFNLSKNILGAGVLSLPYAIAEGTGLVYGIFFSALLAALSAYTFWLIGLVCFETGETTFKGTGTKAKNTAFGTLIDVVCVSKTFFSVMAFSIIIHDTFPAILASFGFHVVPSITLVVITFGILLPLCLLRSLDALKPFSILGTAGMVYTVLFMTLRLMDGSYAEGGIYHNELVKAKQALPAFGSGVNYFGLNAKSAILLATLSTAFIAHYNAPRFYDELEARSPDRFSVVSGASFFAAMVMVVGFMVVGYLTFGTSCAGMILNNYSVKDPLATAARMAIGGSILCSYPLAFAGLRDGYMSLAALDQSFRTPFTIMLLVIVTYFALSGIQIGFVQSLGGAVFGALLIYIFPGYMCMCVLGKQEGGNKHAVISKVILLPLGVLLGVLGSMVTIFKDRL